MYQNQRINTPPDLDETQYTGYLEYAEHDGGGSKVRKRPVLEILILVFPRISPQFQHTSHSRSSISP